jgi:16S rRNA (cytosine1402-N4)-methyltransferase
MRLDVRSELTAFDVVNRYGEKELERVFRDYSDAPRPRRIVRKILERRGEGPIRSTRELASLFPRPRETRGRTSGRTHPAATVFQAIRIEVNDELNALREGLVQAFSLLVRGGRLLVISFHSLEDRIVKRYFREKAAGCRCPAEWPQCRCDGVPEAAILTPKPIRPALREETANPRSRSARLRVMEKTK